LLCRSGGITDEEDEENRKNKEPPNYSKPTQSINSRATMGNNNRNS